MEESANTVIMSMAGSGFLVALASAYIGIWCLDRSRQALLVFAAMCVAVLLGEAIWLGSSDHGKAAVLVRSGLYTLGVALLCEGILRRSSRSVHPIAAPGFVVIVLLLIWYSIYAVEEPTFRNFVQSAAYSAALSATWWQVRAAPRSRFVEGLLFCLLALFCFAFFLNAALSTGDLLQVQSAHGHRSLHEVVHIAIVIIGISLAATILAATVIEIIETLRYERDFDLLTGVFNRRGFDTYAATVFSREVVTGLVLFDLDHFKQINDRYGHGVGDEVLGRVGAVLRGATYGRNAIGRIGGEEFAVLLVDCDEGEVLKFAERLRISIAEISVEVGFMHINVTASLGVAARKQGDSLRTMIGRADARLYAAKSWGRNRSVSFESPMHSATNVAAAIPSLCDGPKVSSTNQAGYA
ncbi:hypothetical protein C5748_09590 [Phyllobacterium phragmitis]|uniref:diguanylate cyclase n=1 Tax=Phyllobacterium phragmitis TaxID=2670329 RepID=A0A2S9ISL7_9HYPH|nr:GGDEF domain-containing protein [Phyllobacterium phragmitis]PRD43517.1 hypothetical protein C5748_09590 [Phyllobacterium phragmitis]